MGSFLLNVARNAFSLVMPAPKCWKSLKMTLLLITLMEPSLRYWLTLPLANIELGRYVDRIDVEKSLRSLQRLPPICSRDRCLFPLEELTARSLAGEKTSTQLPGYSADKSALYLEKRIREHLQMAIAPPGCKRYGWRSL